MEIPGYNDADWERRGDGLARLRSDGSVTRSATDRRNPFQHDVDRILYSPEFQILQGKTQVVASDQVGPFHNRLTHSLRVAQLGRRISGLLAERAREFGDLPTPSADVVEAACLLHDIGHPPFGHIGEQEMSETLDDIVKARANGRDAPKNYPDGYQANAQNLRVVTRLAMRSQVHEGLDLTRAVLDASIKYPWHRQNQGYGAEHWGVYVNGSGTYLSDTDALTWILKPQAVPGAPLTETAAPVRPVEGQIMDWCDSVSYACHDLEDFVRADLIPLADIFAGLPDDRGDDSGSGSDVLRGEASKYVSSVYPNPELHAEEIGALVTTLQRVKNMTKGAERYRGDASSRARLREMTSALINYLLGSQGEVKLRPIDERVTTLTRYNARLEVAPHLRDTSRALSRLVRHYVIDAQSLATQQHGQRRMIRDVMSWLADDPKLLGPDRLEEYKLHKDALRAAADAVWGMTELDLTRLHRRLSGADYGQLGD